MPRARCELSALFLVISAACHPQGANLPFGDATQPPPGERSDVRTLNSGYRRARSQVLVREIDRPTRAALDYAAYHENFMIDEPEPERVPSAQGTPVLDRPFGGAIERPSLTAELQRTALSEDERGNALAFAPLVEYLLAKKVAGAEALENLGSAVRSESWGQPAIPGAPSQTITEAFVHRGAGGAPELWVKIEFAPWLKALGALPDQDRDGFPELFGKARAGILTADALELITRDYAGHVLDASEIKAWANQLSSYWYPSFNTDLVPATASFPDDRIEPDIAHELGSQHFAQPTIVLRGKPQGKPTYEVFLVKGVAADARVEATRTKALALSATQPTPNTNPLADAIRRELADNGDGAWEAWAKKLAPFDAALRKRLQATPRAIKAVAGADGFLFFRQSIEFVIGGDIERQPEGKNPLPVIVEFKNALEAHGVDFLFVPVPAKEELFPEALDPKAAELRGLVVNPYARKFVLSLCEHGVEVVDLLAPFLAARTDASGTNQEPLYQRQDTHWSARGLELAAALLAARVKQYPWYAELAGHAQAFSTKDASFTRFGDLQSRLPEASKKKYQPETLAAHQVVHTDGAFYEDDPESPIVVLGDSNTSVYELMDAEHAGLSAHLARELSYPIDLVMSYGGGPNVRNKLMRRGRAALTQKKLVIWVMADRDLYDYWENWEPLSP